MKKTTKIIETVGNVKARQTVWIDWMEKAVEGLQDSDKVETETLNAPFGSYLLNIKRVIGEKVVKS